MIVAAGTGFLTTVVAVAAGMAIAGALFPTSPDVPLPTGYLSISVAAGFLGAVAGGYIASRMAPDNRRLFSVAILVLLFLGTTVVTTRLGWTNARRPFGFLPLVTLLGVVGTWAGAMAERAVYGSARS